MLLCPVTPLCHCCNVSADCNLLFHVSLCNCFDDCAKKIPGKAKPNQQKKTVGVNATHQETDNNLETILPVHRAEENILIKGKTNGGMFFSHYNAKLSNTWHNKQKVFHPLCIVKIRHENRDILCFRSNFVFSDRIFCIIISLHSQSDSNRSSRVPKLHGSRFPGLEGSVPILHGLHPCCLSQQILLGKKMCSKKCVFFPMIYRLFVCQTYDLMHAVYPRKDIYRFDE